MVTNLSKIVSFTIPKNQYMPKSPDFNSFFIFRHAWFFASLLLIFAIAPTEVRSTNVASESNDQYFRSIEIQGPLGKVDERMSALNLAYFWFFPAGIYTIARIEWVDKNIQGVVMVRGRVKDCPAGYIIINTAGNDTLAEIRIPQKRKPIASGAIRKRNFAACWNAMLKKQNSRKVIRRFSRQVLKTVIE